MSTTTESPIRNGVDTATLDAMRGNNEIAKFRFRGQSGGSPQIGSFGLFSGPVELGVELGGIEPSHSCRDVPAQDT